MILHNNSPWPDAATARPFLAFLAGIADAFPDLPQNAAWQDALATWLIEKDVAALAAVRCREPFPSLAERLQAHLYDTAAENSLHWHNLKQINERFLEADLTAVLLKGAALAETVYDGPAQRAMADVDLWLAAQDMAEACVVVAGLDFFTNENVDRPLALQALSNGEVQFYRRQGVPTLVELHLSPFEGWWLKRTAVVNDRQVLARKLPLPGWGAFYQLAPEDMVIHLAIHLAIGHQFGAQSVRTLVDIARLAFARDIDWQTVAARARDWRVATAVWLVLYHEQQLVGLAGLDSILDFLQPTHWRRQQLLRMVSEQSILSGGARRGERERYRLLLLLVDRSRDAGRLVFRTLWPEGSWLHARYGGGVGHWQHWQHLLREGRV